MALGSLRSMSRAFGRTARRAHISSRAALGRWFVGLAIAFAVIWVVVNATGGLADAEGALGRTEATWVGVAVFVEAISYVLMGVHLRRLARGETSISRRLGIGLALVISGFGLLTPASPAEGLAIAGRHLRQRGFGQRQTTLTLGFTQWFSMRVFLLVAALNVMVAVGIGDLPAGDVIPLLVVAVAGFVLLVVTAHFASRRSSGEMAAVLLGRLRFWRSRVPIAERKAVGAAWHQQAMSIVGSPANRALLAGLAASALLADMGCLWASLTATGVRVGGDVVILAATAGLFATAIPLIPGGLGVMEAVIPAVLHHFGAPLDAALAGALVYRVVGTFLPAAAGVLVIAGLALTHRREEATRADAPSATNKEVPVPRLPLAE